MLLGRQAGILFLFVFHEYREYHVVVAETSWPDLSVGLRAVIYFILKIAGGGFTAFGGWDDLLGFAHCPRRSLGSVLCNRPGSVPSGTHPVWVCCASR